MIFFERSTISWTENSYSELFIETLEQLLETPITIVSTGPEREALLTREPVGVTV